MGFPVTPTELSLDGSFSTSGGSCCGGCCGGGDEDLVGS